MTTFYNDTFTDAANTLLTAHNAEVGGTYVTCYGSNVPLTATSLGGVLAQNGGGAYLARNTVIAPTPDVKLTLKLHWDSNVAVSMGVTARMDTTGNVGYMMGYSNSDKKWTIYRLAAGGTAVVLAASAVTTYTQGTKALVDFSVTGVGTSVELVISVAGVTIASYSDTSASRVVAAGYTGIHFSSTLPQQGMFIDSLSAVDVPVVNNVPTFSGTIDAVNGTGGVAITPINVTARFSDTDTLTYSASPAGTAWPAGLVISSAGVISGTVAIGTTTGIKVRATDTASQTVDSNAFNVVMSAVNTAPTAPNTIANITGTGGVALTPVSVASSFADTDTLTYSPSPAGTAWPSGLVINATTGVISGTVATSTTNGLKVRATDTGNSTVDSNAFNVVVSAPVPTTGTFTTEEWGSAGTVRAGQAFTGTWFKGGVIGVAAGTATLVSGNLDSTGKASFTVPLGAGIFFGKTNDGGIFYQAGTVI